MRKLHPVLIVLFVGLLIYTSIGGAGGVAQAASGGLAELAGVHLSMFAPLGQVDDATVDAVRQRVEEIQSNAPLISEHFRQDDGVWNLASNDEVARFYEASTLHISLNTEQTVAWSMSTWEAGDFYLEVDAFHVGGSLNNEFGVVFRHVDDDNFYLFGASSDGYYTVQRMQDGEWQDLEAWTESDVIRTGEGSSNRLGILAEGFQISLLINGEVVAVIEDETFDAGLIGLVAGTFEDPEIEVAFDDLFVWSLDETESDLDPEVTPPAPDETPVPDTTGLEERLMGIREEEPRLSDDFRRDTGDWAVSEDETVSFSYVDRSYHIRIMEQNWVGYSFNQQIETEDVSNFLVEVDAGHVDGPVNAEYGFIFHFQDGDNFYLYAVSGEGTYSLWKKEGGQWTNLVDWTEDARINAGEGAENHLGLLVEGSQITLLANDQVLLQIEEEPGFSGSVGLLAGTFDEADAEISFDNFDLWVISPDIADPDTATTPEPVDISARLQEIRSGDPAFSDDFRRENDAWRSESDEDTAFSFEARTYRIEVISEGWLGWSFNEELNALSPADFLAEVDVRHIAGPLDGEAGLVFRFVDTRNFYLFAATSDGYYTLQKEVDGEWITIVDWTMSELLETGEGASNHLGVLVEGAQITLLVNDAAVAQVEDEEFAAGAIGLAAGTFDQGGLTMAFDNLDVWVLSSAPDPQGLISPDPADIEQRLANIRDSEPVFSDDFRRNSNRWSAPDYDDVTFSYEGGAYRIGVNAPNITPGSTSDITVGDFLLEVDAAQLSGPTGQYGVFFRQLDDDNFYLFAVSPSQTFSLWKYVETEWTSLIEWTESDTILAGEGEVNRMGVLAEGAQITLLINDVVVAQIEDSTFLEGMIALAAGTFDEAEIEVEFDNVNLWSLDTAE